MTRMIVLQDDRKVISYSAPSADDIAQKEHEALLESLRKRAKEAATRKPFNSLGDAFAHAKILAR